MVTDRSTIFMSFGEMNHSPERQNREKVFFISLGCAKNLVDTEHMLGLLLQEGLVPAETLEDADIAVINTCGFLQSSVEEAIEAILETAALKTGGGLQRLIVTGCFVQRYGYKLAKGIPEVDAWLGTGEISRIVEVITPCETDETPTFHIGRPLFLADHSIPRVRTTPFFSAYLKVSEGCSHRCSYCIIPALRGPLRSRSIPSLVEEAEAMALQGVREINLIAQDTTMYGRDLEPEVGLEDLLEKLVGVKGIRWIRLLYCHPSGVSDRLLELMESEDTICPYLDLPLQHVSTEILSAMGRPPGNESPLRMMDRIRSINRKISLRTSLIVGFPGETTAHFKELCTFVEEARFDHLGVFAFSPEKGTAAAGLKPAVAKNTAEKRRDKLMELQSGISHELNQGLVGITIPVLIEGYSPETDLLLTGRSATMAPDVDGQVLINKGEGIIGEIMDVKITEAYAYDLIGEVLHPKVT